MLYSTLYISTIYGNQWIESQLPSRLPPNRPPPSTTPISLDHSLQVHLETRLVTGSECIFKLDRSRPPSVSPDSLDMACKFARSWPPSSYLQTRWITASKCISILAWLRPAGLHDHGLQVHISKLAQSRPPSVSPDSLNHCLLIRSIMASKCISKLARSRPPRKCISKLDRSWLRSISFRCDGGFTEIQG